MNHYDVLVVGSLNMDLVTLAPLLPKPGETIHGRQFTIVPGGKGANQAAAISRLGAQVAMVGRVGADAFGEQVINNLTDLGVDTRYVTVDGEAKTGIATILVDDQGENSIVVTAGANYRLNHQDIDQMEGLLSTVKFLVLHLEIPLEVIHYAIEKARSQQVKIVLNSAPAYPGAKEFLKEVDYLLLNETEAQVYTGHAVENESDAESTVKELLSWGMSVVILTMGKRGALLGSNEQVTRIPTWRVEVVDTTAAGDAFTGGFTIALLNGFSLEEAVKYANAVGALTVTRLGAQSSLPSSEEVHTFLETHSKDNRSLLWE